MYLQNNSGEELAVEFPVIGYKGYGIDCAHRASGIPYISEERGGHGDLKVMVPGGYMGEIKVSYKGFADFRVAEAVSLVTLLCVGIYFVWNRLSQAAWNRRAQNG